MSRNMQSLQEMVPYGHEFPVPDGFLDRPDGVKLQPKNFSHEGCTLQLPCFLPVGPEFQSVLILYMFHPKQMIHVAVGIGLAFEKKSLGGEIPIKCMPFFT